MNQFQYKLAQLVPGEWGYDMNGRRRCSGGQRSRSQQVEVRFEGWQSNQSRSLESSS